MGSESFGSLSDGQLLVASEQDELGVIRIDGSGEDTSLKFSACSGGICDGSKYFKLSVKFQENNMADIAKRRK